jgi:hypothetical protein
MLLLREAWRSCEPSRCQPVKVSELVDRHASFEGGMEVVSASCTMACSRLVRLSREEADSKWRSEFI